MTVRLFYLGRGGSGERRQLFAAFVALVALVVAALLAAAPGAAAAGPKRTCSRLESPVDGASVQSEPTQDELEGLHPFSFCPGPQPAGPPWIISGDTGIHPSATGYGQLAAQVPAPE